MEGKIRPGNKRRQWERRKGSEKKARMGLESLERRDRETPAAPKMDEAGNKRCLKRIFRSFDMSYVMHFSSSCLFKKHLNRNYFGRVFGGEICVSFESDTMLRVALMTAS